MLGDFASLDVQNTYRGSDAYECFIKIGFCVSLISPFFYCMG
ncbi:hypothetical protein [Piscirickettsia salmonis]|nr:hypothetical protein [Piscirickettsia salmonis]